MASVSSKLSNNLSLRNALILFFAATLSLGFYILISADYGHIGFPLDDSWIHLTYARNLATYGEWAFLPGYPSAGSTAPLWSALLAVGFLFHLDPMLWTYFLGGLILFLIAINMECAVRRVLKSYIVPFPFVGLFFVTEWHLVWAAGSGMETLFYTLIVSTILLMITRHLFQPELLGLLCGVAVWVRPDGLTLIGPIVLVLSLEKKRLSSIGKFIFGFGLLAGIYFLFNFLFSGNPFPNTFYAKQAEYSAWQNTPFIKKIGLSILQIITGPFILLIPGVFIWLVRSVRVRDWNTLAGMIWVMGYLFIYTLQLPPYQHGRYLIPAMPILFFCGLMGVGKFVLEFPSKSTLKIAWVTSIIMVTLGFLSMGAKAYAQDVAYIETEMVATARWVKQNLPQDVLLAAHDIGALGYFDDHILIDLAGLVSPQVIPFIRDESRLAIYLTENDVDYLITFPSFYPQLTGQSKEVFSANSSIASLIGGEDLSVYQWGDP